MRHQRGTEVFPFQMYGQCSSCRTGGENAVKLAEYLAQLIHKLLQNVLLCKQIGLQVTCYVHEKHLPGFVIPRLILVLQGEKKTI